MIFARRSAHGPDPHLEGKIQIFFVGGALALLGMALDSSILVGLALVLLIGGVFLRLLLGRSSSGDEEDSPEEGDHEENDRQ